MSRNTIISSTLNLIAKTQIRKREKKRKSYQAPGLAFHEVWTAGKAWKVGVTGLWIVAADELLPEPVPEEPEPGNNEQFSSSGEVSSENHVFPSSGVHGMDDEPCSSGYLKHDGDHDKPFLNEIEGLEGLEGLENPGFDYGFGGEDLVQGLLDFDDYGFGGFGGPGFDDDYGDLRRHSYSEEAASRTVEREAIPFELDRCNRHVLGREYLEESRFFRDRYNYSYLEENLPATHALELRELLDKRAREKAAVQDLAQISTILDGEKLDDCDEKRERGGKEENEADLEADLDEIWSKLVESSRHREGRELSRLREDGREVLSSSAVLLTEKLSGLGPLLMEQYQERIKRFANQVDRDSAEAPQLKNRSTEDYFSRRTAKIEEHRALCTQFIAEKTEALRQITERLSELQEMGFALNHRGTPSRNAVCRPYYAGPRICRPYYWFAPGLSNTARQPPVGRRQARGKGHHQQEIQHQSLASRQASYRDQKVATSNRVAILDDTKQTMDMMAIEAHDGKPADKPDAAEADKPDDNRKTHVLKRIFTDEVYDPNDPFISLVQQDMIRELNLFMETDPTFLRTPTETAFVSAFCCDS